MPRRYRDKPDYSRLYGRAPDFILDAALQNRTFGHDRRNYEAEVNAVILKIFGSRTILRLEDLREMVDGVREPRGWSIEFALDYIGNAISWGIHLGIVERVLGTDGTKTFRLLHAEPAFEVISGKAVRVLGLPADEQIAMNVRRSKLRRLRETLARKRDVRVQREVTPRVDRLIAADRHAPVPEALHPFLGDFLVGLADDVTVGEVRDLLLDAHHGWEADVQKRWLAALAQVTQAAEHEAWTRRQREAAVIISQEDVAAFADI